MIQTNEAGQWRPKKNRLTNTLSLTALIISALTTFLMVRENRRMDFVLHYLDSTNSADVKAYNDTFAKAHTGAYYIGHDGRYKLWTDSEIANIRAQAITWQTYSDSEIVARAGVDSILIDGDPIEFPHPYHGRLHPKEEHTNDTLIDGRRIVVGDSFIEPHICKRRKVQRFNSQNNFPDFGRGVVDRDSLLIIFRVDENERMKLDMVTIFGLGGPVGFYSPVTGWIIRDTLSLVEAVRHSQQMHPRADLDSVVLRLRHYLPKPWRD